MSNFVPSDQQQKIAALRDASRALGPVLNPPGRRPAPSDQDDVAAIRSAAHALLRTAAGANGSVADHAREVAALLNRLADAPAEVRSKADAAIVQPLTYDLDLVRRSLALAAKRAY